MDFLIKYLKELNSANSEKFIVLAVVLGLISGFLPTFNIITIVILFIVFIFRIPIGLYTASWGAFKIVGYFLDHIFHLTGLVVLKADILNNLWTYLYNLPLIRWSGFNNSIIMGSFIWGIILAIITYIFLSKSIKKYREILFPFFQSKSYLKWLVPKEKKQGIFRLSGLIIITSFSTIIISFFIFFTDPILKTILQYSLSKSFNKPVKIEILKTSFIQPSLKINNIQIDKFHINNIYIKLSWKYLVWKKFDIEKLVIDDIKTQESITQIINKPKKVNTKNHKQNSFKFDINLPNPKSLLANNQLKTIQAIDKLKKDYKYLDKFISSLNTKLNQQKQDIIVIKNDIEKLDKESKNIKTVDDIQKILKNVNNIKIKIKTLNTNLQSQKNELNKIKTTINNDLTNIQNSINYDYQKLSSQYDMIKNQQYLSFANTILKPEISKYINQINKIYNFIKPYSHNNSQENEMEYIRAKGVTITFTDKIHYPNFLLQKLNVNNIKFKNSSFTIDASNITNNQKITNKNTIVNIYSTSNYYKELKININYFLDNLHAIANLNHLHLKQLSKNFITLYNPIINLASSTNINKGILNSETKIFIKTDKIELQNNKQMNKVLQNIKKFNLNIKIKENNLNISSNIDKLVTKVLNKFIDKEINAKKQKLKQLLTSKVEKNITNTNIDKLDLLNNKLNNQQNYLNKLKNSLNNYSKEYLSKKLLKQNLFKF